MTENTRRGIRIVGGIANTAHSAKVTFTKKELNTLLDLFDHQPVTKDGAYVMPDKLVAAAIEQFRRDGDTTTSDNIKAAFPWLKSNNPLVDLSLLD
jgi:hypothetical protein